MSTPLAIPDLVERLSDEDASVRAAAIKALADLDAKGILNQIVSGLDDADDSVREQALASLPRLEAAPAPELVHTLERLLGDSNARVAARAAVVLMYLGEPDKAGSCLAQILKDADEAKRLAALEAYRAIALESKTAIPLNTELILNALNDPVSAVRRQALLAAGFFKDETLIEPVARRLDDEDAGVRRAASESLKQAWPESRDVLLRILHDSEGVAASLALDAIPVGDLDVLHPLSSYIQREVSGIRYLRMLIDSLPAKGRMVKLLVDTLKHRISLIEERLVKAVGLFGNRRAMELVRRGLRAGNASARAAALEALETLGDKRITTQVLPILDRGGVFQADAGQRLTLNEIAELLLTHKDRWLRAMGTYVVIEMDVEESVPEVRKMYLDEDPLVKAAARDAWSRLGGSVSMKTLKTLSTLDRVLLLREVPMFSGISPEDLEQIAEIAEEQLFLDQAILCREGEYGHTLFIIASGVVDVLKKSGTSEKVLASRSTGDFVGEMAILESAPRSATLRARGGVRTLVIEGDAFQTILLDRPQVAVAVLRRMSTRVRELNEKIGAGG
jgi:HEAT repeat protein